MERFVAIMTPEQLGRLDGLDGLPHLDPEHLVRHRVDAHRILIRGNGEVAGRCSLWWQGTPSVAGQRLGLIGHYAVRDACAARRLLRHACEQLAAQGCTLAVGPMDGNTWRRYRLIVERGSEPVFFLEPDNPDEWPGHFRDCGFAPLAHYSSTLNADLDKVDPRMEGVAERLDAQGIRIRTLNPTEFEGELRRIYAAAIASFSSNFLYTPISEMEFLAQYSPLRPHVRPDLVFLAELGGRPVGFLFGMPDLLQARRGRVIDTVMIKTLAVVPECAGIGLGSLLSARCQETARNLGFTRVIYAFMHETNASQSISRHYARSIRRYTLFAKPLGRQPRTRITHHGDTEATEPTYHRVAMISQNPEIRRAPLNSRTAATNGFAVGARNGRTPFAWA